LRWTLIDEDLPRIGALEVAAAADEQRLFEPPLQRAVRALDVAVLLLRPDLGRPRRHPKVPHQRQVVVVERPAAAIGHHALGVGDPMRRRRRVVGLVVLRHAP